MDNFLMSVRFLALALTASASFAGAAPVPPEWSSSQEIQVAKPGLTKLRLPVETLAAAQPSLSDLRLFDASGQEVPFFMDQPEAEPAAERALIGTVVTMEKKRTVITGTVPTLLQENGFEAVKLFTPASDFLKPATLEGSADRMHWTLLLRQAPLFKQTGEETSSALRFAKSHWPALRLTLDDSGSPPLRVAGVQLFAPARPLSDFQDLEPRILEAVSDARQSVVRLFLPAEGLTVASVRIDTTDTTFHRNVRAAVRTFAAGEFRDRTIGQGSIYRVNLGERRAENPIVWIGQAIPSRQVTLTIDNGDSPPLRGLHIRVRSVPRDLVFDAPAGGTYRLCAGNPQATPRSYDVAELRVAMAKADFQAARIGPLETNPDFRSPEPAVRVTAEGTDIDVTSWRFRKPVQTERLSAPGLASALSDFTPNETLRRVELDLETIAHNAGRLEAVRLVRDKKQIPYVVDYLGVERDLALKIETLPAPSGKRSRWAITLPYAGAPITRLRFAVSDPLFQRTLTLYEEPKENSAGSREQGRTVEGVAASFFESWLSNRAPESGEEIPMRILSGGTWTRIDGSSPDTFSLELQGTPQTNRLILETENGDNPPIYLAGVQGYYRAPRLLFLPPSGPGELFLYYGQPDVAGPQYDLNLIAGEILNTPPTDASLGPEEVLQAKPWWEASMLGSHARTLFWGVMGLVVLGLLIVIAKLLPAEPEK
jgi:hypothetical protein